MSEILSAYAHVHTYVHVHFKYPHPILPSVSTCDALSMYYQNALVAVYVDRFDGD